MSGTSPGSDKFAFDGDAEAGSAVAPTGVAAAAMWFHPISYLTGLLTALVLVGGVLWLTRRADPSPITLQPPPTPAPTATPPPSPTPGPIVVFVSGGVPHPGTYQLAAGARVADALQAAGGLLTAIDPAQINQAERIYDGAQVHVPLPGAEAAPGQPHAGISGPAPTPPPELSTGASKGVAVGAGPVNINTASADQLQTLPGIGPSKAAAIIANRPYATVDDLDRVPGIGAATLGRLRPLITVE